MARKQLKKGSPRMVELGYRKVEVWFTQAQLEKFAALANAQSVPVAKLARQLCNFAADKGPEWEVLMRLYLFD